MYLLTLMKDARIVVFVSGKAEIGNGYGLPGGGAYGDASKPNIATSSKPNLVSLCVYAYTYSDASKTNIATTSKKNLTSLCMCVKSGHTYSDASKLNIATTTKPNFHYVCMWRHF